MYFLNFTLILRHIKWKLWTSIKASFRLGKHLNIYFFFIFFFSYNLISSIKRRLRTRKSCITRDLPSFCAPPLFRSIYSGDRNNYFFSFFILLGQLLLKAQFNLVSADILKNHGMIRASWFSHISVQINFRPLWICKERGPIKRLPWSGLLLPFYELMKLWVLSKSTLKWH